MATRRLSAVPDSPRRAALYVRVSDVAGRQAEQFHSPDLQLEAMRRYAAAHGLAETAVFSDIDATGRNFARAGIRGAIAAAKAKEIDALVVLDLSRLGRNTAETLRVIAELRDLGVAVVSTVEQIDDTPEGQFMLSQFLAMAQLYSDQTGRRWRTVHAHMASKGRQVGQPPLGYFQEPTGRVNSRGEPIRSGPFLVDPVLGPAVRQVFVDYAAGVRVRVLAQRLSDLRGRPVWPAQVRKMVRSRFYLGWVSYKGVEDRGVHSPLVDEVTFAACLRRVARDAREPSRRLQVAHALTGLAVCDACNARAVLRSTMESSGRVRRLGCPRQSDLKACAGCGTLQVDLVEAEVLAQVTEYVRALRVDDAAAASRRSRAAQAKADAVHLERELRANRSARARLAVRWAQRQIPEQQYLDADGELAAAEDGLVWALESAQASTGLPPRKAQAAAAQLLRLWPDASAEQRRRMLVEVVAEVRLRRAVFYREPASARVEVVFL